VCVVLVGDGNPLRPSFATAVERFACQRRDIYCEKPISVTLREGRELVEAV
jgi:predicted dehydrogenase